MSPRTGRPPIPNELKRLRGTLRKSRIPPPPINPYRICGECGVEGQMYWVYDQDGVRWGPFCEDHTAEAVAIIEGDE
jgi:hypothetical protein